MSRSVKSLLQPDSSIASVTMIPNGLLQDTLPITMSPSFKHCKEVKHEVKPTGRSSYLIIIIIIKLIKLN